MQQATETFDIAIAFPGCEEPPIVIDLATCAAAYGKIEIARRREEPIPPGWAIDASGDATQVPTGHPVRVPIGGLVISPSLSTGLGAEFIEVVSDTRCAPGAVCDDPGEVEIVVLIRQLDFEFGTTSLILRGDQTLPSVKRIGKFSVALIAVDPVPVGDSTGPIATLAIVEWSRPR